MHRSGVSAFPAMVPPVVGGGKPPGTAQQLTPDVGGRNTGAKPGKCSLRPHCRILTPDDRAAQYRGLTLCEQQLAVTYRVEILRRPIGRHETTWRVHIRVQQQVS